MTHDVRLASGVVLLVAVTYGVLRAGRVPSGWAPAYAVARGATQLVAVGLLLRGVFTAPPLVVVALTLMFSVAAWTAVRRLSGTDGAALAVPVSILAGLVVTFAIVFGAGMLAVSPRYLVALGGILIGGTMLGVTIAGRTLARSLAEQRDEVEAWLALGATPRQAAARLSRRAAAEALVPVTDQTRTTGLVTLPGAFIGALLGGASPTDAARFQLVVLAGLLCTQAVAVVVLMQFLGAPRDLPNPETTIDE
ncbi:ABC transporter permease [Spongisporangium articulatum]|uniref:ABC transporter permease n=1 Tax=Spongisporangium articulatum TaxID=3362603 RepID=A0ABW8ALJ4_9ACTN